MPLTYSIDRRHRLVLTTASGVFTAADALNHQRHLRADPDFDETFDQLADFTSVTEVRLTGEEIRLLAERSVFSKTSRRAVVAKDALIFGLARMFASYRDAAGGGEQIRIYPDRQAALNWLLEGDTHLPKRTA